MAIGNGSLTAFWLDPWIHDSPLCSIFPALFALEEDKYITVGDCFSCINGQYYWRWRWRKLSLSADEGKDLEDCMHLINSKQWYTKKKDIWIWGDVINGEGIVKFIQEKLEDIVQQTMPKIMKWNSWVPPKVNTLI